MSLAAVALGALVVSARPAPAVIGVAVTGVSVTGLAAAAATTCPPSLEPPFTQPEGWVWGSLINEDGARLRFGHARPKGGRGDAVVLLPGYREFGEKYFEVARHFLHQGFAVWQLDWRGQGGSERYYPGRDVRGSAGFDRDAADLQRFIADLVDPPRWRRVILVAHSMAGPIALKVLADHPGLVAAAVLSAPLLALRDGIIPRWLVAGVARTAVAMGLGDRRLPGVGRGGAQAPRVRAVDPGDAAWVRGNLQVLWEEACPAVRTGGATFGWLDAASRAIAEVANEDRLKGTETPVLIGAAGDDLYVDRAAIERAAALMPAATLMVLEDAHHELFLEREPVRSAWLAAVDRFLADLPPRSGAGSHPSP